MRPRPLLYQQSADVLVARPPPPAVTDFDLSYPVGVTDKVVEVVTPEAPPEAPPALTAWRYSETAPERTRKVKTGALQQSLAHLEPMVSSAPSTGWSPVGPERTRRRPTSALLQSLAHLDPRIFSKDSSAWGPVGLPTRTRRIRTSVQLQSLAHLEAMVSSLPDIAWWPEHPEKTRRVVMAKGDLAHLEPMLSSGPSTSWGDVQAERVIRVRQTRRDGFSEYLAALAGAAPGVTDFDLSYPLSALDVAMSIVSGTAPPAAAPTLLSLFPEPQTVLRTRRPRLWLPESPEFLKAFAAAPLLAFAGEGTFPDRTARVRYTRDPWGITQYLDFQATPGAQDYYVRVPMQFRNLTRKPRRWVVSPTTVHTFYRNLFWSPRPHLVLPFWEAAGNTARDVAGASRNAVAVSAGATPVWGIGAHGPCLDFDETDDRMDIPLFEYEPDQATVTPEITIAILFQIQARAGTAFQYIFSQGVLASSDSINIYYREDSAPSQANKVTCQIRLSGAAGSDTIITTQAITDTLWHTFVMTIDRLNDFRVYLDGVFQDNVTAQGTGGYNPSDEIRIGSNNVAGGGTTADRFFGGRLGLMSIFRSAWSADQVKGWHKDTVGFLYPSGGLVVGFTPTTGFLIMPEQIGIEATSGVH